MSGVRTYEGSGGHRPASMARLRQIWGFMGGVGESAYQGLTTERQYARMLRSHAMRTCSTNLETCRIPTLVGKVLSGIEDLFLCTMFDVAPATSTQTAGGG